MSMKNPLKENIQNHYRKFELSSEQLDHLTQLQKNRGRRDPVALLFKISFAALVASVLLLSLYLFKDAESIAERLSKEVAYNHNKNMPMEIKTSSLDQIQNYLIKLDFKLIQSERISPSKWELVGGRYCSLQGRMAALMKIVDKPGGKGYTFYQVPYFKDLDKVSTLPLETYIDGIRVKLWREKSLLLALAGS